MATNNLITIKSYFSSLYQSFPADLIQKSMFKICYFIWVLVYNLVSSCFRHFVKHLAGSKKDENHDRILDKCVIFSEKEENLAGLKKDEYLERILDKSVIFSDQEDYDSAPASGYLEHDGFSEEVKSEFSFGFGFDDFMGYKGVNEEKTGETEDVLTMNTSKYEFVSVKDFNGFVVEPELGNFTAHEMFVEDCLMEDVKEKGISPNSDEIKVKKDFKFIRESGIRRSLDEKEVVKEVEFRNLDEKEVEFKDEKKDLNESSNLEFVETEVSLGEVPERVDRYDKDSVDFEEKIEEFVKDNLGCGEVKGLDKKSEVNFGENKVLEPEKVNWLGDFFGRNDSFCYGDDCIQENEFEPFDHQLESEGSGDVFISFSPQNDEPEFENLVSEEMNDDYIELEPDLEKEYQNIKAGLCFEDTIESERNFESDSCFENLNELENEVMEGGKVDTWDLDLDEEDEADVLLEHQELIGQMKAELKNARTGGLPTILEESETPRVKEDLKPLEINEKLEHRDLMAEVQKFYKSYSEKMRKLDVLNYQTLQAINFLRMKHPDQINTGENASLSAIKSVLLPSLWPCKLRRIYADPTLKSVSELHKDLEIVYVGQACLSWEMLHWQYKKAKELQLFDPQGYLSYNQIAIEFQQFHVLLRRFTEDELFQGPRVHNYTKQRCTQKGLLQVPALKDGNSKEKKARKEDDEDAVSILTMAKMIKESMIVFWEFLHTDKDTTNLFLTIILQGSKAHLQDPADAELFMDIKTIHHKKEKRLKDMLRTGNCIVKKFQKQEETILDQHMFISQVELGLVSRVLSLPRLSRDQLVWCQSKLNNIKFIDRKIQVEDSLFLLFPC